MENYLFSVAVKKAVYGVAKGLAGILMWTKAQAIEQQLGITIDPAIFRDGLTAFMLAGLSVLHDWLRFHYPNWPWI